MAQKTDSMIGCLALTVTIGIVGSAGWWMFNNVWGGTNPLSGAAAKNPLIKDSLANPTATTLASVDQIPQGRFRYGGSTTWATIRAQVDRSIQIVHPGFQLDYRHPIQKRPSSGAGIEMLLNGDLDFAQSSRALTPQELETAQQRNLSLKQIAVAIDGIAVAVHPDLPVTGLTLDQLRRIYIGGPSNWRDVGGPDLPIVPLLRKGSGSIDALLSHGQKPSDLITPIATTTAALNQVAQIPGALYFTSAPEVVPQCTVKTLAIGTTATTAIPVALPPAIEPSTCPRQRNKVNVPAIQNGSYPLTRGLYVIIKQDGGPAQKAGEAYTRLLLSTQGQDLISQADFVRIH
jgi:phosphate transport system substrate-binding protein